MSKPRQDVAESSLGRGRPTSPTPGSTRNAAELKDYQRTIMIARSVVLAELDRMVLEGMAQNRAIEALNCGNRWTKPYAPQS